MTKVFVQVSEVRSVEGFTALRGEWTDLLSKTREPAIFHSWEWLRQWWRVYGERHFLRILCARDASGVLRGIWPLYAKRNSGRSGQGRVLAQLGTGEAQSEEVLSEYADIIADPPVQFEVVRALWQHLSRADWDTLFMPAVLNTSCLAEVLLPSLAETTNAKAISATAGVRYCVKLPSSWDEYLRQLGQSKRQRVNNYRRRLVKEGGVYKGSVVEAAEEIGPAIERLIRLHEGRWKSQGLPGAFASSRFRTFHTGLCTQLLTLGQLDLRVWSWKGADAAAFYGFRSGDTLSYYQSGFDASVFPPVSLGTMAVMEVIEWAIEQGYRRFDFMGGPAGSYKAFYGCETVPLSDITLYNATARGMYQYFNRTVRQVVRTTIDRVRGASTVPP